MRCEYCGSPQTRTLPAIYAEGQEVVINQRYNDGYGRGGSSNASGTIETRAQRQAAPPRKRFGIIWVLPTAYLLFSFLSVVTATLAYSGIRYNREEWPEKHDLWTRSWYCADCARISIE